MILYFLLKTLAVGYFLQKNPVHYLLAEYTEN